MFLVLDVVLRRREHPTLRRQTTRLAYDVDPELESYKLWSSRVAMVHICSLASQRTQVYIRSPAAVGKSQVHTGTMMENSKLGLTQPRVYRYQHHCQHPEVGGELLQSTLLRRKKS
jgi:hypothetical protein